MQGNCPRLRSIICDFLQIEIGMISTGPERDATIVPEGTLLARWL
jgi:hypothetical protein